MIPSIPPPRGTPAAPAAPAPPVAPDDELDELDEADQSADEARKRADSAIANKEVAREMEQLKRRMPRMGRMGLLTGAHALERTGRRERAEELLRKQKDPIAHAELFLVERRGGKSEEAKAELLAYLKHNPGEGWPMPLLQAMAGTRSDKSALEAAHSSGDPDDVCEAAYYLGMVRDSKELLGRAASPECDFSDLAREALGQSR